MILVLRNTHKSIEKFLYKLTGNTSILLNNTLCLTLHLRNVLWSYSSHPPLIPPVSCKNFYNEDKIDFGVRTSFDPIKVIQCQPVNILIIIFWWNDFSVAIKQWKLNVDNDDLFDWCRRKTRKRNVHHNACNYQEKALITKVTWIHKSLSVWYTMLSSYSV